MKNLYERNFHVDYLEKGPIPSRDRDVSRRELYFCGLRVYIVGPACIYSTWHTRPMIFMKRLTKHEQGYTL
jgi:hypothetical protein